jgi:hypothetical protein
MPNEINKQKVYDTLREQISSRLIRAMDITEAEVAHLSLGELLNMLFLVHGAYGSTGNFNVTFGAAQKLVGPTMMWYEPEAKPAVAEPEQRVN